MAFKEIELPDIGLVKIYKRRGAASVRLSVTSTGQVRVSQPTWLPYASGEVFARNRTAWILEHLRAPAVFRHGQSIGKAHQIYFRKGEKLSSKRHSQMLVITHPAGLVTTDSSVQRAAERAAIAALKREAESLLPQRLKTLANQHGFNYKSTSVRRLKSRWGSCSQAKEITLNIFLMELPWFLIDYVLLHELCHTREMNHGKSFWDELLAVDPRAKEHRQMIKDHRPAFTD